MLLYEKIQSFSYADMHQFRTSSLVTRMTNDITQIQHTAFSSLRIMMRAPLLVVGSLAMAVLVNWKLALAIVLAAPFAAFFLVYIKKVTDRLFREVQQRLDKVNGVLRENLEAMRLIRAFNRSGYEEGIFTKVNRDLRDDTKKVLQLIEVSGTMLLFIMNLAILVVLWAGNRQLYAHHVRIGEIVAVVNYGFRITGSISMFSTIISNLSRAKASLGRTDEVLHANVTQTENGEDADIREGGNCV
ncbi:hypothetical protein BpJC7_22520 [Weizmannia acidilactici]|uniref:ABC transmembrane type-1 domain-containing protein n=1 Tax=Weizmannia acidilactici TaxID=2607726 RepID=A0A5J4JI38_9BACI|nr:hypothetical protein BpJC4_25770 [Weizmannia acidilactici]GER70949.1 hypothetical protein BpJC7_22520 [Weizmannia acidilactici]